MADTHIKDIKDLQNGGRKMDIQGLDLLLKSTVLWSVNIPRPWRPMQRMFLMLHNRKQRFKPGVEDIL